MFQLMEHPPLLYLLPWALVPRAYPVMLVLPMAQIPPEVPPAQEAHLERGW